MENVLDTTIHKGGRFNNQGVTDFLVTHLSSTCSRRTWGQEGDI